MTPANPPGATWLDGIDIVDAHHHFWDLGRFPYGWLAPGSGPGRFGDKATLRRNFLPDSYLHDFAGLPLSASVHVQANCGAADPVEETRWLQHLSDETSWPTAIVAEVDLLDQDAPDLISRHLEFPALRGIRTPVAWDAAGRWRVASRPAVLDDSGFRAPLSLLEENGLCLEMVIVPEQFDELISLARGHPDLTIVVNHFATLEPDQPENAARWMSGIAALTELPNVNVKLSGLWTVDKDWSPAVLTPFVDHILECLGPDRVMYGSNLPVEAVNCPLDEQISKLKKILEAQSIEALKALFSETAKRVYLLR